MASRPPVEQDVLARARLGDGEEAYVELVRPHQEIAFRTALLITRNAADAEDAAQDAIVKAYRALGRFRDGSPFRPWLLAIVANEARNSRRGAGRRESLTLRAAAEPSSGARLRPPRMRFSPGSVARASSGPSKGCRTSSAWSSRVATSST